MASSISRSVGLGVRGQQRGGRHDLAGLAVAALRNVDLDPGQLHADGCCRPTRPSIVVIARADGRGAVVPQVLAGMPSRCTVQAPHCGDAAAVLGAGERELFTDGPRAAACRERSRRSWRWPLAVEREFHRTSAAQLLSCEPIGSSGCACRWRRRWRCTAPARSAARRARRRRRAVRRTRSASGAPGCRAARRPCARPGSR